MKIRQAIVYPAAVAAGVAILGSAGVYSTVRPNAGRTSHGVSMITVAAADRAGATVSPTEQPHGMATWAFK